MASDPSSDYGNGIAGTAQTTGENAINNFNPVDTAGSQIKGYDKLTNSQIGAGPQNAAGYMGAYSNAIAQNPTAEKLYTQGNEMFNVPQLQNLSTYLNNQMTNAMPDAYTAARGSDISNTDVTNGIAAKMGYLTPQANAATANANTASGLAQNYVQAGMAQNAVNLQPIQAYGPMMADALARQSTGYNQANQSEFQGLINKMQSGVQLSQEEMDRANTLAQQETSYQNAITSANAQIQSAQIGATASENVAKIGAGTNLNGTYYNPYNKGATYNPYMKVG